MVDSNQLVPIWNRYILVWIGYEAAICVILGLFNFSGN